MMLRLLVLSYLTSISLCGIAQSDHAALDSMGANINRKNWAAAIQWALKDGEQHPADRYWRYLNAATFASLNRDAELTLQYAKLVVDSDIGVKAKFGENFDWLSQDERWKQLMAKVAERKEAERLQKIRESLPFRHAQDALLQQTADYLKTLDTIKTISQLYHEIRQSGPIHRYTHSGRFAYYWLAWNSLNFPYLVQLPLNFDPAKKYPMIVVLHGAVGRQAVLPDVPDSLNIGFFGIQFAEKAAKSGMIAVFPYSTKQYNWMMPDDGFELIPELVRQVKKTHPIDDSRVYIAGHSNGATGAFSYLMKNPQQFAGFAGVNNRPQVRTGGTFLLNASNRSFYNVATDFDYYFPLEGHRVITQLAEQYGIDWQNREITGNRTHGYLISSRDSVASNVYADVFDHLLRKERNPFKSNLVWECDDVKHGRCDWLEINELDTLATKASWHTTLNVPVSGWRQVERPEIVLDSTAAAFAFPRRSGTVQAAYTNNRFELKTSRVKSVTLYLSPEMIDFTRPVQIRINGKLVHNTQLSFSRDFALANYKSELDHQAVWVNKVTVNVP